MVICSFFLRLLRYIRCKSCLISSRKWQESLAYLFFFARGNDNMHSPPKPGGNGSPQRLNEGPLRRLFMIMTPIMPRGEWHARPGIYRNAIGKKRGLQLDSLSHSFTRACIWQILCVNKGVRDLRTRWGPQTFLSLSSAFYPHTDLTLSLLAQMILPLLASYSYVSLPVQMCSSFLGVFFNLKNGTQTTRKWNPFSCCRPSHLNVQQVPISHLTSLYLDPGMEPPNCTCNLWSGCG